MIKNIFDFGMFNAYIWSAVGITIAVFFINIALARIERKKIIKLYQSLADE